MLGTHHIDELDRKILHALQIDGRAPFQRIAEVVGVSPQTVQRRYGRLRAEAGLRVTGQIRPEAVGEEEWLLRIRCAPDRTGSLARALARHDETSWVHIASGGTEIMGVARAPAETGPTLLRALPNTPRVREISAHCLLHTYYGGELSIVNKTGPLDAGQVAALRFGPRDGTGGADLTATDRALTALLARDGRTGYPELARAAGCSVSTAQRRLIELRRHGVVYFDLDHDPRVLGRTKLAMLWLTVGPAAQDDAGRALAAHPEVSFAASTTGPTNLYAAVNSTGNLALHRYLTGPVAALPGVTAVETAPITETVKRAGAAVR
ncbi:Lrp/AsnC family transcriptional regulator [Amycolatopsis australiensis]|uniref:DNA-binding transcriptional regulator, Lrp family n=1 Tax=Amycolatopsis australiensis TaxID=546364 RepID=A0A1K1S4A3_9PSEU|nr:Lrp/AsnC family transcriptional regulator [Amycolatopsis australiensis]SFW79272.1 DNA-binding transcriptional regulator, Lrp family [Amycolatopsis australiensis]